MTCMMKKLVFMTMLLATVGLWSCGDDDDHEHVNVTFQNPTEDATVAMADAASVEISILLEAEEELHDVEIMLYADGESDNPLLEADVHEHEKSYTFKQNVDLSGYDSGTMFHLKVEACEDHDCEEKATEEIHFTLE